MTLEACVLFATKNATNWVDFVDVWIDSHQATDQAAVCDEEFDDALCEAEAARRSLEAMTSANLSHWEKEAQSSPMDVEDHTIVTFDQSDDDDREISNDAAKLAQGLELIPLSSGKIKGSQGATAGEITYAKTEKIRLKMPRMRKNLIINHSHHHLLPWQKSHNSQFALWEVR